MMSEDIPSPDGFVALVDAEFGPGSCATHLIHAALRTRDYARDTALQFLATAKGRSGESWEERGLALLLLEGHLLRLPLDDLTEFDLVLVALGLKPDTGEEIPLRASVLQEGFSTVSLRGFVVELVRRLSRLRRVHESILRSDRDEHGWGYFLRAVRDPSKITLARYVFSVEDVFREIIRKLQVTDGAEDTLSRLGEQPATLWAQELLETADFEGALLSRLCADRKIYWVSDRCSSELNSLVEYPLTTAAIVIKPPGSDLEIEIKRAGTRGPRLLNVITERNGAAAPTSHRLFGGSLGWLAQRETAAAGIFSAIYRLVHGTTAPCSRGVLNSSIVTVPTPDGHTHILDYLTDEERFGPGLSEAREAMRACIASFPRDTGVAPASYGGERGMTLQFIGQALPQQAVICGSSSFRLDRIVLYLSDAGPEEYFRTGLCRGYTRNDARWLADSVLEEILCDLVVPSEGYLDYSQYVRDAFRVPQNRRRANENYVSVMRQTGECWGTLLAVRGFSDGESFVLRNVGLKSIWKHGEWQIRIVFMDHDDLTVAGSRYQHLWPSRELSGMQRDSVHVLGGPMGDEVIPGDVGALKEIYRVSSAVGDAGVRSLEEAMLAAYKRTQSQITTNQDLRRLFPPRFLEGYLDLDDLVPGFLETDPSQEQSWTAEGAAFLRRTRHYDDELIAEYMKAICRFRQFFERISFLYSR